MDGPRTTGRIGGLASPWFPGAGAAVKSTPLTEDSYCEQKAEKECQVATTLCGFTVMTSPCQVPAQDGLPARSMRRRKTPGIAQVFTLGNVAGDCNHIQTNSVYVEETLGSGATQADIDLMNDKCAYVFQGSVASGSACTVKYDCKDKNQICDTKNGTSLCSMTKVHQEQRPAVWQSR